MRRSVLSPSRVRLSLVLMCAVIASGAGRPSAAQQPHNMDDMEMIPPPEQLPVPIKLDGIGNSHIAIKATPGAQAWFDQGLSLMHDFWNYESEKAFEQAIRVD